MTEKIKRIFITGGPGSMWSGADRLIRSGFAGQVDNSDINHSRNWIGHRGVYFNPGNEPGYDWILNFDKYDREEIIRMLDGTQSFRKSTDDNEDGVIRTYKSHNFCYFFDHIEKLFPEADIVAMTQIPYKALYWWTVCGGHDHVHDPYDYYDRDLEKIWNEINTQTSLVDAWIEKHNLKKEYLNLDFFRNHFGEPSEFMLKEYEDRTRSPDGLDHRCGAGSLCKNLSNTAMVVIKYGTPRQFEK